MKNIKIGVISLLLLQGCATDPNSPNYPIKESDLAVQTYTYTELQGNQSEIWKKARNYIATAFGDSKAALRVEDESSGILIGKGLVQWKMLDSALSPTCYSEYTIQFAAKDGKARLQLELLSGAPALSECTGWRLPSKFGYNQILSQFSQTSKQLEVSLKPEGKQNSLTDF